MSETPQITIVVAMNEERVIGSKNQLPWHIPEDLAYFKEITLNKPIIMGRKTFESIGRILPNRKNIVISRNNYSYPGIYSYGSLELAIEDNSNVPEICIIGGGEIFSLALPLATQLHITRVDYKVSNPDAWFPEFNINDWVLCNELEIVSKSGIKCVFMTYKLLAE